MSYVDEANREKATEISREVVEELVYACRKFPKFNSAHEGYAVILEELDELWYEIKGHNPIRHEQKEAMREEVIQVAAMAIRFVMDVSNRIER